jgi:hypothetical protein
MSTSLQRAQKAILLKALLVRALKSLAPIYTDLSNSAEGMEEVLEGPNLGLLAPVWGLFKSLDSLIDTMVEKSDKEFPEAKSEPLPDDADQEKLAKKVVDLLKRISDWAEKARKSVKELDEPMSIQLARVRDESLQTASGLEDLTQLEHEEEAEDDLILQEYRLLAGLPVFVEGKKKS